VHDAVNALDAASLAQVAQWHGKHGKGRPFHSSSKKMLKRQGENRFQYTFSSNKIAENLRYCGHN
jgi:hypothetical protein